MDKLHYAEILEHNFWQEKTPTDSAVNPGRFNLTRGATHNSGIRPNAIVLGGTVAHRHLTKVLKARGYRVILIDYLTNPPAAELADEHITASSLDRGTVLKIARDNSAELVLSPAVDQAHVTALYCCEKLGIPTYIAHSTVKPLANKQYQKKVLAISGVPTAAAEFFQNPKVVQDVLQQKISLNFPLVVKPVDSNGSKGVSIAWNNEELSKSLRLAFSNSRKKAVMFEQLNKGPEFNFYFFIIDFKPILVFSKIKVPISGTDSSLFSPLSIARPTLSPDEKSQILKSAQRIATNAKIPNGPLMIQANLVDGEFRIIEFTPRLGGGLSTLEIYRVMGIDLLEASINQYQSLSEKTILENTTNKKLSAVLHIYAGKGTISSVMGLKNLIKQGYFQEYYFHRHPQINTNHSGLESRNRLLVLRGEYAHLSDIVSSIEALRAGLTFLSNSSTNLLRRDLLNLNYDYVKDFFPSPKEIAPI